MESSAGVQSDIGATEAILGCAVDAMDALDVARCHYTCIRNPLVAFCGDGSLTERWKEHLEAVEDFLEELLPELDELVPLARELHDWAARLPAASAAHEALGASAGLFSQHLETYCARARAAAKETTETAALEAPQGDVAESALRLSKVWIDVNDLAFEAWSDAQQLIRQLRRALPSASHRRAAGAAA